MSIFEPPWPEMNEQMRRDLEAGRNENFRATFMNANGYAPVPDGTLGTCWKTADFAKKDSLDCGMWLFKPDNNESIYYCEECDLRILPQWRKPEKQQEREPEPQWPQARDTFRDEWNRAATHPRNEALEKHGAAIEAEILERLWPEDKGRTEPKHEPDTDIDR